MKIRRLAIPTLAAILLLATAASAASPAKKIVCFGDSITAGYGLEASKAYPAALQNLLESRGYRYTVVNQGVSGNTTKDALARLNSVLALHPDIVLVEFGGNDGLRGLSAEIMRGNLEKVVVALKQAHIQVLLVGITLPPNFGEDYIHSFDATYRAVAAKYSVPLKPMLYDGIYTVPGTIQEDGIHPTAKGSQLIAEHLLPLLLPMLHK